MDRGFKLSETQAILTYLAESKGDGTLVGKTPKDKAFIRQIEGVVDDLLQLLYRNIFIPDYKAKLQEAAANEKLLRAIRRLQNHFSDGRDFALGYFTLADIVIAHAYKILNHVFKSAGLSNPMEKKILYDHAFRVDNLPGIKEYYASDQYKNMVAMPGDWLKEHPLTVPAN